MHMRRFTRWTNGFSKKLKNHIAAISPTLHVLQLRSDSSDAPRYTYNGCRHDDGSRPGKCKTWLASRRARKAGMGRAVLERWSGSRALAQERIELGS